VDGERGEDRGKELVVAGTTEAEGGERRGGSYTLHKELRIL